MIPQIFIQELLARTDIVEVVRTFLPLKQSGANFFGLCPFHRESSPSFSVSQVKQFYYCFGCGQHGRVVDFLMTKQGIGYVEAVQTLATRLGWEVPREEGDAAPYRSVATVLGLLEKAASYYVAQLTHAPKNVLDYLRERGLMRRTAERFRLGYAPDAWQNLSSVVPDYEENADLLSAGLLVETLRSSGARRYDRFRERLIFPIRDVRGNTVGFGGRLCPASEGAGTSSRQVARKSAPKYLNSPETDFFSKSRILYGLFEGDKAIRRFGWVVVVEGYLDVLTLSQNGIENVVATLGTSVTASHLRVLFRKVSRLIFAFDGDAAGRKAAWRALTVALPLLDDTQNLGFVFLTEQHDPDSWVRTYGAADFRNRCLRAYSLTQTLFQGLTAGLDLSSAEGRVQLLLKARPLFSELSAPALRMQWVQQLAELAGVTPAQVDSYLQTGTAPIEKRRREEGVQQPDGRVGLLPQRKPRFRPSGAGIAEGARRVRAAFVEGESVSEKLQARIRLLCAMYPSLWRDVAGSETLAFTDDATVHAILDEAVLAWLSAVGALMDLPENALDRAQVVAEDLFSRWPEWSERLLQDLNREACVVLSEEEAKAELLGAIVQLRAQCLSKKIDLLVASGLTSERLRERYQFLMGLRKGIRVC